MIRKIQKNKAKIIFGVTLTSLVGAIAAVCWTFMSDDGSEKVHKSQTEIKKDAPLLKRAFEGPLKWNENDDTYGLDIRKEIQDPSTMTFIEFLAYTRIFDRPNLSVVRLVNGSLDYKVYRDEIELLETEIEVYAKEFTDTHKDVSLIKVNLFNNKLTIAIFDEDNQFTRTVIDLYNPIGA